MPQSMMGAINEFWLVEPRMQCNMLFDGHHCWGSQPDSWCLCAEMKQTFFFLNVLIRHALRISLIMLKIPDLILYNQRTPVVDKTQPTQKSRSNDVKTSNTRWSYSLLSCLTAVSQLQQTKNLFKSLRGKSPTKANTDHRNGNHVDCRLCSFSDSVC